MPRTKKSQKPKNEIVEIYRGHPIRTYNVIVFRVSQFEIKKFIDAKIDNGISARQLIEQSSKPCHHCIGTEVQFINKDDEDVKIKRGFLYKNR